MLLKPPKPPPRVPPPSEHISGMNWIEVRRQYEVDGLSAAALTQQYRLKSRTTIARRVQAEGWVSPRVPKPSQLIKADPDPMPEPPAPEVEIIPMATIVAEKALEDTARDLVGSGASGEIIGPNALAELHTQRIKEQLALSKEVSGTGRQVFSLIRQMLDPGADPETEIAARTAMLRLTNVNPDKDTLAGLMKAAADVIKVGVSLERQALGMDVRRKPGDANDPLPEMRSPKRTAAKLIEALDADTAYKLRSALQARMQQKRQDEIKAQTIEDER